MARAEVAWYRGDLSAIATHAATGVDAAADRQYVWTRSELAFWRHRADPKARTPPDLAEPYAMMIASEWEAAAAWQRLHAPYGARGRLGRAQKRHCEKR